MIIYLCIYSLLFFASECLRKLSTWRYRALPIDCYARRAIEKKLAHPMHTLD